MTNDRAVEILKAIIFMLGRDDYTDEVEEAIHMAIEALEREACADESTCNDLATNLQPSKQDADDTISRKAAINAIDVKNVNKGIISALQSIIDELPSAQPETHEKRTETHACDCIERQAAIDFIAAGHLCNPNEPRWSDNEVVNFLKSRPSAQPDLSGYSDRLWKAAYERGKAEALAELPEWAQKVEEYRKSAPSYVQKPLAWALYQVWKEYDG